MKQEEHFLYEIKRAGSISELCSAGGPIPVAAPASAPYSPPTEGSQVELEALKAAAATHEAEKAELMKRIAELEAGPVDVGGVELVLGDVQDDGEGVEETKG